MIQSEHKRFDSIVNYIAWIVSIYGNSKIIDDDVLLNYNDTITGDANVKTEDKSNKHKRNRTSQRNECNEAISDYYYEAYDVVDELSEESSYEINYFNKFDESFDEIDEAQKTLSKLKNNLLNDIEWQPLTTLESVDEIDDVQKKSILNDIEWESLTTFKSVDEKNKHIMAMSKLLYEKNEPFMAMSKQFYEQKNLQDNITRNFKNLIDNNNNEICRTSEILKKTIAESYEHKFRLMTYNDILKNNNDRNQELIKDLKTDKFKLINDVHKLAVQKVKLGQTIINNEENRKVAANWANNAINKFMDECEDLKEKNISYGNKLRLTESNIKVLKNTINDLENRDANKIINNYADLIKTYNMSDLNCKNHEELIGHFIKIISINHTQKNEQQLTSANKTHSKFVCKLCYDEEISFICCKNNHCIGEKCKKKYDDGNVEKIYKDNVLINTCPLCRNPIHFKQICL